MSSVRSNYPNISFQTSIDVPMFNILFVVINFVINICYYCLILLIVIINLFDIINRYCYLLLLLLIVFINCYY